MTWIVVAGSTIEMLLWIVVYSFFLSNDFVDEAIVLLRTLTFWAAVLLTGIICLSEFFGQSRFILQLIILLMQTSSERCWCLCLYVHDQDGCSYPASPKMRKAKRKRWTKEGTPTRRR